MVMNGRIVSSHRGFSLIETIVSLALTSMLILGVSKLTLSEMLQHRHLNEHYFLQQQVSVALDILRQQLLHAGYNANKGDSVSLSGSEEIVTVNADNSAFAFTYLKGINSTEYQTVSYQKKEKKLILCEKTTSNLLHLSEALVSNQTAPCYSVFDSRSIQIEQFVAKTVTLINSSDIPKLDVLLLTVSASLISHPEIQIVKTIEQPLRNWR